MFHGEAVNLFASVEGKSSFAPQTNVAGTFVRGEAVKK